MSPTTALLAHIDIPPRLLASLIVLGICLVFWFFKAVLSSPEKGAAARPGAPSCPTCGNIAAWQTPQNYWNCVRCNRPVPPPGPQPMANPYGAPPPAANPYAAQGPTCQTCSGPGRWIAESNVWGCDRCRQVIQPRV